MFTHLETSFSDDLQTFFGSDVSFCADVSSETTLETPRWTKDVLTCLKTSLRITAETRLRTSTSNQRLSGLQGTTLVFVGLNNFQTQYFLLQTHNSTCLNVLPARRTSQLQDTSQIQSSSLLLLFNGSVSRADHDGIISDKRLPPGCDGCTQKHHSCSAEKKDAFENVTCLTLKGK